MDFTEPPPFPGQNAAIRFTGDNAAFRRIVVRGTLLELVTFGFYRFWLTTDMRRHLWSNPSYSPFYSAHTNYRAALGVGTPSPLLV